MNRIALLSLMACVIGFSQAGFCNGTATTTTSSSSSGACTSSGCKNTFCNNELNGPMANASINILLQDADAVRLGATASESLVQQVRAFKKNAKLTDQQVEEVLQSDEGYEEFVNSFGCSSN